MNGWKNKRTAYVSHSLDAGGMLAIWLDERPSCEKGQRDPDGWVTGVAGTKYEAERLAELAKAPGATLVLMHGAAAEWWKKIDTDRRRKAARERNAAAKGAQTLFSIDPEVEELGRAAAVERLRNKTRKAG